MSRFSRIQPIINNILSKNSIQSAYYHKYTGLHTEKNIEDIETESRVNTSIPTTSHIMSICNQMKLDMNDKYDFVEYKRKTDMDLNQKRYEIDKLKKQIKQIKKEQKQKYYGFSVDIGGV